MATAHLIWPVGAAPASTRKEAVSVSLRAAAPLPLDATRATWYTAAPAGSRPAGMTSWLPVMSGMVAGSEKQGEVSCRRAGSEAGAVAGGG